MKGCPEQPQHRHQGHDVEGPLFTVEDYEQRMNHDHLYRDQQGLAVDAEGIGPVDVIGDRHDLRTGLPYGIFTSKSTLGKETP